MATAFAALHTGLGECLNMLLACFRKRMSDEGDSYGQERVLRDGREEAGLLPPLFAPQLLHGVRLKLHRRRKRASTYDFRTAGDGGSKNSQNLRTEGGGVLKSQNVVDVIYCRTSLISIQHFPH